MQFKLRSCLTVAVGFVVSAPTAVWACGGLFCAGPGQATQVVQTGERILFAADEERGVVHAVINIQYQGAAEEFAWLLPLRAPPEAIRVGPSSFFTVADRLTAPTFRLDQRTDGLCTDRPDGFGFADNTSLAAPGGGGGGGGGGVQVLQRKEVGPYASVVLGGEDPEEIRSWLTNNGFTVTDDMMESVVPYLAKGDVLLALNLRKDEAVGDIQPVWLEIPGDELCIPLRLTAIAALSDMDVTAFVLSNSGRAIPTNYFHVELNLARIDWPQFGANYRALVSEAADEGEGNAFTTEYAGPARVFDDQLDLSAGLDVGALERATTLGEVRRLLQSRNLLGASVSVIARHIPDTRNAPNEFTNCPTCRGLDNVPIDGAAVARDLEERVFGPERQMQALVDRFEYATRLYTLISPEEMTIDPFFQFDPTLPDASNLHVATLVTDCGAGLSPADATRYIEIEETGERIELGSGFGNDIQASLATMPAARRVDQLAEGTVHTNNADRIADLLGEHNRKFGSCGCSTTERRGSSWGFAILLALFVALRRRRE